MRKIEVIRRIKDHKDEIAFKAEALYLYGSTVRDEATPASDIDLFVDPAPGFTFVWQARRAIERGTEIISEATRHLLEQWFAEYSAIPWLEIKAIGNRLRHEYRRVDDKIMWSIATQSVRQLRPAIIEMHGRLADEMTPGPHRSPP